MKVSDHVLEDCMAPLPLLPHFPPPTLKMAKHKHIPTTKMPMVEGKGRHTEGNDGKQSCGHWPIRGSKTETNKQDRQQPWKLETNRLATRHVITFEQRAITCVHYQKTQESRVESSRTTCSIIFGLSCAFSLIWHGRTNISNFYLVTVHLLGNSALQCF